MAWILFVIVLSLQHGNVDNGYYFVLVRFFEIGIILDLIFFGYSLFKSKLINMTDEIIYHEGDDIKVKYHLPKRFFCKVSYHYKISELFTSNKYRFKTKGKLLIKDVKCDDYLITLDKVRCTSFFHFFFFTKRPKLKLSIRVYPKMIKCDLDKFQMVEEKESDLKGNDYTEISGFHKYEEGEDTRHIHYILSAKKGEYIVKEGSRNALKCYHYLFEAKDFKMALKNLGEIYYLFETYVLKNHEEMIVTYQDSDCLLLNRYDLYGFFDRVYEDFL